MHSIYCRKYKNVPGRPVISNNGTTAESISAFLDFHVKATVPRVPHILEDARDFLSRLNELCEIPENAYLEWFDVVGSYPHQPYEENLEILKCCLDKGEDQWVSSENFCGLVKMILKHNYFELVSDMCHQLLGTAISTKFTPNYANNFIAESEEIFFKKLKFKPYLWIRYLDDIFYIWTEGLDKLKEFFNFFK